ncbi:hypothetical protein FE257_005018 [Aspergillus nanangensis]|uniref:DUF6594 domain-containing protein n=1 Tax=Aspergillus nanangensis TaxID=2582783 RepID=A0AAD4CRH4_ASPNN|nr:hypothetical protein FE257_005018 [Aspergillus nanangensis]
MPLYSASVRPKKARKDGANKAPVTSVLSMTSHPTSKASRSSAEKPKKEGPPLQPALSKGNISAAGFAHKAQAAMDSKIKSVDTGRTAPNVFEYLEDGESDSETSSEEEEDDDGPLPAPTTSTFQSKSSYAASGRPTSSSVQAESGHSRTSSMWSKNSLDSSQLSTLDTSPTSSVPLQLARKTTRKPSMDTSYGTLGSLVSSSTHARKPSLDLHAMPEAYYPPPHNPNAYPPPFPPSPPRSPEEDLHRPNRKSRRKSKPSNIPSGYGLLAWRLSSSTDSKQPHLPPLYRRFEDLNHRVLLHLQDEIAQMEEDLRVLDEYEELHRVTTAESEGTKKMPSSRRMDVQAQVYSSLHYRRGEVMGSLAHKIEQYNNALSAYSKVLQNLPQASDQDVTTYRSWMKQYTPVITAETRFLDHAKDLVSLTPRRASSVTMTPVYSAIVIASAAILLPLLAYGMIAEFSGRLLVVTVVGGAAAIIASSYSTGAEQLVGSQDGWRCAAAYFGFMTIAAMFIP